MLLSGRSFLQKLQPALHSARMASTKRLEDKVAVVTASSEGIGFAIAKKFAENGAKVIISSRKEKKVAEAVKALTDKGLSVSGTVCHVGNAKDRKKLIQETVERYGKLDILISNAAANPSFGPVIETQEEAWDKIFDINVKSSFLLAKECYPHLEKTRGSIVFVSSLGGYMSMPGLGAYGVSKTALLGLTKVLANELASSNIRVNCVAPGVIKTKFSSALWASEEIEEQAKAMIAMRRLGSPDEVSGTALFLCSEDASYITGETILVTGGVPSRL